MNIKNFTFYRYLGSPTQAGGLTIKTRSVFGVFDQGSVVYLASPDGNSPVPISPELAEDLVSTSRAFTIDPAPLFQGFSWDAEQTDETPELGMPVTIPNAAEDAPVAPATKPKPSPKTVQIGDMDFDPDSEDGRIRMRLMRRAQEEYRNLTPLVYEIPVYMGGTRSNYKTVKLEPLGARMTAEIAPFSVTKFANVKLQHISGIMEPPIELVNDLRDNVLPAVGLKQDLGFKQVYIGVSRKGEGSYILSFQHRGRVYGIISIDPDQTIEFFGGFNSQSVAHVVTHELAHYIDHAVLRNVSRMKWDQSLRGKVVHPLGEGNDASSMRPEHFATLAELMVWGYSLRQVYYLNGIDVVSKYFINRYIPESDIEARTL